MRQIIVIAHDIRSCHNVGSLLRTAEGLGVNKVYMSGYTPYPAAENDTCLPHIAAKLTKDIHKTALDAETLVDWEHAENLPTLLDTYKTKGYTICGLEQSPTSVKLPDFQPPEKVVLLLGREVEGLEPELIGLCDQIIEIPMFGKKESFNVVQAAAIALYHITFAP